MVAYPNGHTANGAAARAALGGGGGGGGGGGNSSIASGADSPAVSRRWLPFSSDPAKASDTVPLAACKLDDFQLWHTAPLQCGGAWALLGELGKWVPVSPRRFTAVGCQGAAAGSFEATAPVGEPAELRGGRAGGAPSGGGVQAAAAPVLVAELSGAAGETVVVSFTDLKGGAVVDVTCTLVGGTAAVKSDGTRDGCK